MELLKDFGFEPRLLVAQIVNFLIVLYVLRRFLYKPVLDMLKKRQKIIEEGLKNAEDARLRLEKATEEEKAMLKQAQKEAVRIIDGAKKQASELLQRNEEVTKKQTEKMIQDAKSQIQQESEKIQQRLSEYTSNLAVHFLKKSISDLFSEKDQKEILNRALKKLHV